MATLTLAQARQATAPAIQQTADPAVIVRPGFDSAPAFDLLQREAKMFNLSTMVPPQFQGPQNFANAVIAVELAGRLGASALQVMQELYIVQGRPCFSAKFLIATFNRCGRFSAIRYEFTGTEGQEDWGCRAVATELATGNVLAGATVTIGLAKAEKWFDKSGSKWRSMPGQMLRYRAAAWFIRAYAPEISMGIRTVEEERDGGVTIDYDEVVQPKSEIAGNGPTIDSPARSEAPLPTTQEKPKRARKTPSRATTRPLDLEPAPAPAPAPQPATVAETETVEQGPDFDAEEQQFIAMCDGASVSVGEALSTFDDIYGETDSEVAVHRIVTDPNVWAAVRSALPAE